MLARLTCLLLILDIVLTLPAPRPVSGRGRRRQAPAVIRNQVEENFGDGHYHFSYETADGEIRDESGEIRLTKTNVPYLFVKGYYSYFSKDNKKFYVIYEADDKGYRQQIFDPEVKHNVDITNRFSGAALASLVGGGIGK